MIQPVFNLSYVMTACYHYKVEWIVVTANSIALKPPNSEFNEQRSISDAIDKIHTTNLEMERQLL